jgi:hypothetical protein
MKNPKNLAWLKPTEVRGKWLEVKNINHCAKDAPFTNLQGTT